VLRLVGVQRTFACHPQIISDQYQTAFDDTQILLSCCPSEIIALQMPTSACFVNVTAWIIANKLQPNPLKNEIMWCLSAWR